MRRLLPPLRHRPLRRADRAFSVDSSKISAGDTAWMLTSTALVLFMTIPGLALFYAGMVRKKNVLATVMQSFAITAVITVRGRWSATASRSRRATASSAGCRVRSCTG